MALPVAQPVERGEEPYTGHALATEAGTVASANLDPLPTRDLLIHTITSQTVTAASGYPPAASRVKVYRNGIHIDRLVDGSTEARIYVARDCRIILAVDEFLTFQWTNLGAGDLCAGLVFGYYLPD